jgi:hypothetical protein
VHRQRGHTWLEHCLAAGPSLFLMTFGSGICCLYGGRSPHPKLDLTGLVSQNGEDGIIAEIFSRIGCTDRIFVEIGAGDGLVNNTAYLLFRGWQGFWFEANEDAVAAIEQRFHKRIAEGQLKVSREFFTAENAAEILVKHGVPESFDLLSIDIDRNTPFVWKSLTGFRPRVAVVEYNAAIPPQDEWEVQYHPNATWNGSLYFGAGLRTLERIGTDLDYSLVGCDLSGTNAFFVLQELVEDKFSDPFTAKHHYEPLRQFLAWTWGHPRCFGDLDDTPNSNANRQLAGLPQKGQRSLRKEAADAEVQAVED